MTGEVSAADLGMGYRVDIDGTDTNVSATPPLPKGLRIRPLRESAGDAREWLGRLADIESPGVSALNTALFDRGVWVEIAPGTVLEHPVHLVHALGADSKPSAAFPRVLVVAGKGTKSVIVEQYAGTAGNARLTAPVSEIHVGENAHLDHIRVQEESGEAFHVGRVVADQSAGSRFRSWSFALGAKLARVDVEARLRGEAAECSLEGIFAGLDGQHLDHYTRIDHVSPNTTSRETYKGILGGRARGVFLGHILVRPDAQKINAAQTSRSIVLSRGARVNMKPWLEIYADDVACTHGTTVGRLDEDALFYLRSRGIDRETSRAILVRAFAQEVLVGLPLEDLRDRLDQFLLGWLSEAA
jgi:Fe-S cluster assembly protein SufD